MEEKWVRKRFEQIDKNANLERGVFLYGAGTNGIWCYDYLKKIGVKVLGFIDSNPKRVGQKVCEIEVISYDKYEKEYSDYVVFVTAKHCANDIMQEFSKKNSLMIPFDAWFCLKNEERYLTLEFDDAYSYEVLKTIMQCMITSDESVLYHVAERNQYFAVAPFFNTCSEIFVDCGAYTGDTMEHFIEAQNGGFRHIYAIEPGMKQIYALEKRKCRLINEWCLKEEDITIINAAVGESDKDVRLIQMGELCTTQVTEFNNGDQEYVHQICLDHYFEEKEITSIKSDIEGGEYSMLLGAKKIIKTNRPKLSLSVYHRPDDLLQIYFFLKECNPKYRFSLRQHSPILVDTTLYVW